ncbi:ATP-binding protein [Streptomyces spiroverticillatus]
MLQVQLEVGADPAEVGRARRWARSRLVGCGIEADEPVAETLVLLISELVTNAVVHTGCPAVLRMLLPGIPGEGAAGEAGANGNGNGASDSGSVSGSAVSGGTVRVEVADVSACPPKPRHAEGDDTNGRGLELVDGLADRWGWQAEGAGKRIWCEVDREVRPPQKACADRGVPAGREGLAEAAREQPREKPRETSRDKRREPGAESPFASAYEPPFEPSYKPSCAVTNRT